MKLPSHTASSVIKKIRLWNRSNWIAPEICLKKVLYLGDL